MSGSLFVLGTAGHIDHGKTALIRALTGVDTDRLPDEQRRGITIDLGFARLALDEDSEIGIVDVPGHEGFVRNMVAGATGIDFVLLVIAADEGVMPQTREHLGIVELLGVRAGLVAVTKTDLVDAEWLELVLDDVREQLAGTPFASAPVLPVSSVTGAGIDALRRALMDAAATLPGRADGDLFRMPVDRVFSVRGTGTVVTGTVWAGRLASDASVSVLPYHMESRIRGLQVHGRSVDEIRAGQRAAIALADVDRGELARGATVVDSEAWRPTLMLTVRLRVLDGVDWSIRPRQRVRVHLGTAEVMARVAPLDGRALAPGERGWAQLRLEAPLVARAGDAFVIRSYSPVTTIGGGRVVEPVPRKRKRIGPLERRRFEQMLDADPGVAVAARVALTGWAGAARGTLPIETPLAPDAAARAVRASDEIVVVRDRVFAGTVVEEARDRLRAALDRYHEAAPLQPGMPLEELRRELPDYAAPELADAVLEALLRSGEVERRRDVVARAGFRPRLDGDQREARDALLAHIEECGLQAPGPDELPASLRSRTDVWELLRLLEHEGAIVKVAPERFIAASALARAEAEVRRAYAGRSGLSPADFRDVLELSRKHLIPLLEYFDRAGITARRGDGRTVAAGE